MRITYSWGLQNNGLIRVPVKDGLGGVITEVHYVLTGTDEDGTSGRSIGMVLLGSPDPERFTPYQALTPEIVFAWVETALGAEALESKKAAIAAAIAAAKDPNKPVACGFAA